MKYNLIKTIAAGGLLAFNVVACDDDRERPVDPKVIDQTDHVEVNTVKTDDEWEAFRSDAETRIDDNEREIKKIEDEKLEAKKDGRDEYAIRIADLKERNNRLRARIKDYEKDGNQKWDQFKKEFNHDMDELGKALKDFSVDNKK